ncbi:FAD-binding protein [Solimonas sp. K1W22B-7]|uniref:FAD-binding protein n=1 Tax=Solimonas sp. K1W22B-7 TaxID=2303331 RepID=UPI000E335D38|nr:FAD-binding protein [Solimonas sp. K1W22B-7]AXQ28120.1 FAD-binding protein [Solimonas sp. K1W22B-7]
MTQRSNATSASADGTLPIDAPRVVDNAETVAWNETVDLLVVGFGAAGASAAIHAREAGANVGIVERFEGGGATIKSGGIVYLGGGTRQQKAAGYEDTVEAMVRYLQMEAGDAVGNPTLHQFCEDSLGLHAWLESLGARFDSSAPPPKTSYPKDGIYLYYSGNEGVPAFAAKALPAPRGHRMHGSGVATGKHLFSMLRRRVEELQIPVLTQSAVRRLIMDRSGSVIGAEVSRLDPESAAGQRHLKLMRKAEKVHDFAPAWADRLRAQALAIELADARPLHIRATGGVLLSTGGFIFNRDMVQRHAPKYAKNMRLGATGCDGAGIRLGQSAGGSAARLEKGSAWRFINPPTALPRGIVVGANGERFCNEQVYGARLGVEMCEQGDGSAWLILDAKLRREAMKEAAFGKLWMFQSGPALILMLSSPKAKTLPELAGKIGVPAAALERSVQANNASAAGSAPDAFGKSQDMRAALDQGPYYALDISAGNKIFPCPSITLGGLRVEEGSNRVLNEGGQPIAGLYAAGRAAVGVASNFYVSGLSIADCLWSGRRAALHAIQKTNSTAAQAA